MGVAQGPLGQRAPTFFMLLPSLGYGGLLTRSQFTGTLIFSYSWKMTSASSMSLQHTHGHEGEEEGQEGGGGREGGGRVGVEGGGGGAAGGAAAAYV